MWAGVEDLGPVSPVYNMGGSPYIGDPPQPDCGRFWVVSAGFDTIEATYVGHVRDEWQAVLDDYKRQAQQLNRPVSLSPFFEGAVRDHGMRPFAWVVQTEDAHLRLGRRVGQAAGVRLLSVGLASKGVQALLPEVRDQLTQFARIDGGSLTRVDAYCDVQGWVPTAADAAAVVCASPFRPIYPNVEHPETFQFGKGDIVVRVYNKSQEQRVKGGHWPKVWESSPSYKPEMDVWRIEVQLRHKALVEFGLSLFESLECPGPFFRAGLEWCSWRTPTADSNTRRWPLSPMWEFLTDYYDETAPVRWARPAAASIDVERLTPQIAGLLASVGAALGTFDLNSTMQKLRPYIESYQLERGETFSDRVEARQLERYGRVYFPGITPGQLDDATGEVAPCVPWSLPDGSTGRSRGVCVV